MKTLISDIRTALFVTFILVVACCIAYPVAVWAAGQALFSGKADGSLVADKSGAILGSGLLAKNFASDKYFQPRPSAAGTGYDSTSSSGTNFGPTSAKLANGSHAKDAKGKDVNDPGNFDGIKDLVAAYRASNGLQPYDPVPADAVTRSASGLDPHISIDNALIQAARVAKARHAGIETVQSLVRQYTQDRDLGVFGEPGVNVLLLNIALDREVPPR